MNILLDTHVLLWWLADDPQLSKPARQLIQSTDNLIAVSAASAWEISIKRALGKLDAPPDLATALQDNDFVPVSITLAHAERAGSLPDHHRDPFDRMLVAQAQIEQLALLTHDEKIARYDVQVIECKP